MWLGHERGGSRGRDQGGDGAQGKAWEAMARHLNCVLSTSRWPYTVLNTKAM